MRAIDGVAIVTLMIGAFPTLCLADADDCSTRCSDRLTQCELTCGDPARCDDKCKRFSVQCDAECAASRGPVDAGPQPTKKEPKQKTHKRPGTSSTKKDS